MLYVNGMFVEVPRQAAQQRALAKGLGAPVVGVHNASDGYLRDYTQATLDKLDLGKNPAVDTLSQVVLSQLRAGKPVHLVAHSHGALITSRALLDVRQALQRSGVRGAALDATLARVKVETFGGAASQYPDGPQYVHYFNTRDGQAGVYGMGAEGDPRNRQAGAGAVFVRFRGSTRNLEKAHDLLGEYLPHRLPFDEARRFGATR